LGKRRRAEADTDHRGKKNAAHGDPPVTKPTKMSAIVRLSRRRSLSAGSRPSTLGAIYAGEIRHRPSLI
jgi:hypothetical protein